MLEVWLRAGSNGKRAARELLAEALRISLGLDAVPPIARGSLGKPFFPDRPHIHFSLSHSGGLALCALSDAPVGVDGELVRSRAPGLPRYALTAGELAWHTAHGGDWDAFYTLWTRKEAWVKRAGGSAARPRSVEPPLPGAEAEAEGLWSLEGEGWRGAVCAGPGRSPTLFWHPCNESVPWGHFLIRT